MSAVRSASDRPTRFDAVVIGAGHNGLVCAAYLAAAGLVVGVFERRALPGGAAVTEEFHPGFRNSIASYTVSLLHPRVIRDLRLADHGLRIVERPFGNFLPLADGRAFRLGGGLAATQREVARFSTRDAERLPAYYARLDRAVGVLRELNVRTPPALGDAAHAADWLAGLDAGRRLRALDPRARRDLLALFAGSAGDLLDRWFESDPLKAALGWDAVVGNFASPYAAGTAYVLLHHVFGEVNGQAGVWGHAIGGMGAITQTMACECAARGVALHLEAPVRRVLTESDARGARAVGIELEDGRQVHAPVVAGNVGPRLLYGAMLDEAALAAAPDGADFRARVAGFKTGSASFRMNVALAELPDFACAPGTAPQPHHGAGILFAPDLGYLERAYFDARSHAHNAGWSREPIVELNIASALDDTLAPSGRHVASIFCQHFDPALRERWDQHKQAAADTIIDLIDRHAPNFRRSVLGLQVLAPIDLERTFGLVDGDIFHGALQLDQLWAARPVLGWGNYRSPVAGLYLCGSGAHPGGGVTGVPGMNAAREILRDRRGLFARRRG